MSFPRGGKHRFHLVQCSAGKCSRLIALKTHWRNGARCMKHQPWRKRGYAREWYARLRREGRRYRIIADLCGFAPDNWVEFYRFVKSELEVRAASDTRRVHLDHTYEKRAENGRLRTRVGHGHRAR